MKIISWNVNGIHACAKKGLLEFIKNENADIYCFQEVKCSSERIDQLKLNGYFLPAEKKGYSGLLTISKTKPISVIRGLGNKEIDKEGRVLTLEFPKFFLVNAYFPHSHRELTRLNFKLKFNRLFSAFCQKFKKPVIIAADFNVAHKDIDLRNPKQNQKNAGFTIDERKWFDNFLKSGYTDTFRQFVKEGGNYTWWTYRNNARKRNIGWRIDYFLTKDFQGRLKNSHILKDIMGSDHCPVCLEINLS